jgi:1,4-alpha-glucan branching enzyme
MATKGYFTFVLHAHLPYVLSHGRWPHGMDWLSEAAAETYLPLIRMLRELAAEGIKPHLTIDISPVLAEQLADDSFKEEFLNYLDQKITAAQRDSEEFYRYDQPNMLKMSRFWEEFYGGLLDQFNGINRDIIGELRKLQDEGYLEIMTCGATHGYFPLLSRDESCQAQVKAAVKSHKRHFGKAPRGMWLPECAYRPAYRWKKPIDDGSDQEAYPRKGIDEFLSENGIEFFIVDAALLKGGKAAGVYIDRFESLRILWDQMEKEFHPRAEEKEKTPRNAYLVSSVPEGKRPVAVFTRDPETGLLVWSGEHGYPGDGNYLDFHKKRFPGGHRYWAVTSSKSDLADKIEYHHETAMTRLPENARHYVSVIKGILEQHYKQTGKAGILVAPYDAELFGHWWFEGPLFLKTVLRYIAQDGNIELTALGAHLDRAKPVEVVQLPEGSWGQGGYHYIWLNQWTEWTWKHVYACEDKMVELASKYKDTDNPLMADIVKQAARELMLLSASDWQFLISTWSARDYAELRVSEHYGDFNKLVAMADKVALGNLLSVGEMAFLHDCQARDHLFGDIEPEWFARVEYPAMS